MLQRVRDAATCSNGAGAAGAAAAIISGREEMEMVRDAIGALRTNFR